MWDWYIGLSDREKRDLRQGFTTGTAAAAAVKAALVYLFTEQVPGSVNINLLNGQVLEVLDQYHSNAALAVFFGKALKMAQGFVHTHAAKSELTMDWLSDVVKKEAGNKILARQVLNANTARHAFGMIWPGYPRVLEKVGAAMIRSAEKFCPASCRFRAIIYDFQGSIAFDSHDSSWQMN